MSLADVFAGSDYVVNPEFADVRGGPARGVFKDAPLYVQPSVGVPLGGGVLAALDEVLRGLRGSDRGMEIAALVETGLRFGWGSRAVTWRRRPELGWHLDGTWLMWSCSPRSWRWRLFRSAVS